MIHRMSHLPEILLILFILNLGTAFGAGLYESQIVIPQWFSKSSGSGYSINLEAMQKLDSGRQFWVFVTTLPLTLLTLANLVVAWQSLQPERNWWLAAGLITLIERISTFSFFIPTLIKLQLTDQQLSPAGSRLVALWIGLNYVRNGLTLIAWLLTLKAFSLAE